MVNLTNAKVYNTGVKTGHGNIAIKEYRYDLLKKKPRKEDLDEAVKEELKQMLAEHGGKMYVSVSYWLDTIYSTGFELIESDADIDNMSFSNDMFVDYDENEIMDDDTKVNMASIFVSGAGKHSKKGGCRNEDNDCLYYCLCEAFYELPPLLKSAARFKKWLGLGRQDKVDIKFIPKIEDELEMNIVVVGTKEYISDKNYPRDLKIRLWEGHYEKTYAIDGYNMLKKGYCERPGRPYPMMYKKDMVNNTVKCCFLSHGKKGKKVVFTKPLTFLDEFYSQHNKGNKLFMCEVEKVKGKKDGQTVYYRPEPEDVIESKILEYILFQRSAWEMLGEKSKGACNPFRCNGKYRVLATHYFYKTCPKSISKCDGYNVNAEPRLNEEQWIKWGMTGGLIYSKARKLKKAYEADVNSMYPYLMKHVDFITRQGEFLTLDEVPDMIDHHYSLFRCKITGYDKRLFQPNKNNVYTGLDMWIAQQEEYDIELIQDGFPNCLCYDENCRIPGREVFAGFVDDMFTLKQKQVKGAKQCLNILWGYLSSKYLEHSSTLDGPVAIAHPCLLDSIHHRAVDANGKQHYTVKAYDHYDMKDDTVRTKIFRFNFARFPPFLTAMGRYWMYKTVKPIKKYVYRIHTDGFICSGKIKGLDISNKMGDWKIKSGPCEIVTAHKIHWGPAHVVTCSVSSDK